MIKLLYIKELFGELRDKLVLLSKQPVPMVVTAATETPVLLKGLYIAERFRLAYKVFTGQYNVIERPQA